ncbi:hypothetical protein [Peribacillus sp. Bi96]|nr:hypothetical protein [Peribacillus sp. Bi96]
MKEGNKFSREYLVMLSPYLTRHLKRLVIMTSIYKTVEENIPI